MRSLLNVFKKNSDLTKIFEDALGDNLFSLIQYGSSIKGGQTAKSDINLLIVLNVSTPEAHFAIFELIRAHPSIEPFILGTRGLEKTIQSFAVKFLSIKRHHKLLSGYDFLQEINIPLERERFLAEQALRNIRLKLVHAFVKKGPSSTYVRYLITLRNSIFIDISEVLRCEGISLPDDYQARIEVVEKRLQVDGAMLQVLYHLPDHAKRLSTDQIVQHHRDLFTLLDQVLSYVEIQWNE